tara:strand:+ start:1293 stop:1526 length:234 start_codon:yes stop_codon:yes gene_type:complete
MPKTDERFVRDRLEMMESEGWLDLIDDLKKIKSSVVDIDTMTDDKDLFEAKGQLNILRFLLTLENTTKITLEQSQEE